MNKFIVNCDAGDLLKAMKPVKAIFMDPPDNIGLNYEGSGFQDSMPSIQYYAWIENLLSWAMVKSQIVWLSFNQCHDLPIKDSIRSLLTQKNPSWSYKQFIWRYTFGEYNAHDCGSGYRPLVRLMRVGAKIYPDMIKMMSERERIGDIRASGGGRVPDDVWEFSRIQGNNKERRAWHPTQHPEALIERAYLLSINPMFETWVDLFLGTGTSLRIAKGRVFGSELSTEYCKLIGADLNLPIFSLTYAQDKELI